MCTWVTSPLSARLYLSVPASKEAETISEFVKVSLNVSSPAGSTIKNIVQSKRKAENTNSVVYKIPCGVCNKCYIGETFRGANKRVQEHKRDLRDHRETNAIVQHAEREGHLPNWTGMESHKNCPSDMQTESVLITI